MQVRMISSNRAGTNIPPGAAISGLTSMRSRSALSTHTTNYDRSDARVRSYNGPQDVNELGVPP